MDANQFDAAIRLLAASEPRRAALGGALGAGLGAILTWIGGSDAEAQRRRKKRKKKCKSCGPCKRCKRGKCKAKPEGAECGVDQACCQGQCLDLATDGANCGACQHDCIAGTCERGACLCAGQQDCPLGCYCATLLGDQDGAACIGTVLGEECQSDGDCPFRTICLINGRCSTPCLL